MSLLKQSIIGNVHDLLNGADLFHDEAIPNRTFARVQIGQRFEILPITSRRFIHWLLSQCPNNYKERVGEGDLRQCASFAAATAQFKRQGYPLAVRVGAHDGAAYIDLANDAGEIVEIVPGAWRIVTDSPARFLRFPGMLPLPLPSRDGEIGLPRRFVNVVDDDRPLVAAWTIAATRPSGPYPVLFGSGEQGSAKSTTCRVLRQIIDPNKAPIRAAPRNERDLLIAATNARVLAFDNLSEVSDSLSDSLCRLATGGGFSTRTLYTDADEHIFYACRPMMLNGIEEMSFREDLLDRMISVSLPVIGERQRKTEEQFWAEFRDLHPAIFGGLLDVLCRAMTDVSAVKLAGLPRMADFAKFAVAAEPHVGLAAGTFLRVYEANRVAADEAILEASAVGSAISEMIGTCWNKEWEGTPYKLLRALEGAVAEGVPRTRGWPKTPRGLSGVLRRIAPSLRRSGIQVEFLPRTAKQRGIRIFRASPTNAQAANEPAPLGAEPTPDPVAANDAECLSRAKEDFAALLEGAA